MGIFWHFPLSSAGSCLHRNKYHFPYTLYLLRLTDNHETHSIHMHRVNACCCACSTCVVYVHRRLRKPNSCIRVRCIDRAHVYEAINWYPTRCFRVIVYGRKPFQTPTSSPFRASSQVLHMWFHNGACPKPKSKPKAVLVARMSYVYRAVTFIDHQIRSVSYRILTQLFFGSLEK